MQKKKKRLMGKKSRAAGARFELKVRNALESEGWIVDKWSNNVDLDEKKLIKARRKYNPFKRVLGIGTGFPDFIVFRQKGKNYEIVGIEVKTGGNLDKVEKEKCRWYLDNKIFSKIKIAKPERAGRRINVQYIDFGKKYKK
ncbi:MAG TPA: hypothetical protein ENH99_02890 [Candidatus Pacearchaeota archaeon]|nr:hypothetical protein [Candidatus Pacearchaeota archaeon]